MTGGARTWVAGPDEAEAVAGLLRRFRDHLGYDRPTDNALMAGVERLLEDPATDYLLGAPGDGPAVGVVQLRYRWGLWLSGMDCLLEDLYVDGAARRAGLGRALVAAALDRARERGCRRIELDANERNAAAIALYESFGFRTASTAHDGGRDLYFRLHLPRADV